MLPPSTEGILPEEYPALPSSFNPLPLIYSLNVRSSNLDVLLVTITIGTVIILFLFYLVYLIVRWTRRKIPGYRPSKADRPAWVLLLTISGSIWLLSTMAYSGAFYVDPSPSLAPQPWWGWCWSCWSLKLIGQYTLGWSLWTTAVLYKLIRKYVQLRMIRKRAPHAISTIFLLMSSFLLMALLLPWWIDRGTRSDNYQCYFNDTWWLTIPYLLALLFLGIFVVCFVRIRRTIGAHHELIRYAIFLSTSFLFPFFDGVVELVPEWKISVAAGRFLLVLVLILVVGNLTHIAVLVLRRKRKLGLAAMGILTGTEEAPGTKDDVLRSGETGSVVESLSTSDLESTTATARPTGAATDDATLEEINVMMSEGQLEHPASSNNAGDTEFKADANVLPEVVLTRPRRTGPLQPDFEKYVDNLGEDRQLELDRGRGYWLSKARPKVRTVMEFNVDRSFKLLD